jgi:hypothetical protein
VTLITFVEGTVYVNGKEGKHEGRKKGKEIERNE